MSCMARISMLIKEDSSQEEDEAVPVPAAAGAMANSDPPAAGPIRRRPRRCAPTATVYCAGSRRGASGGVGVFWGKGSQHNKSKKLEGVVQSIQRAELVAACLALQSAIAHGHTAVEVHTSRYVIDAMTNLVAKWQERGWVTRRKAPVVNRGDFERLDLLRQQVEVKWVDINHGMHEAARLAHEAK